MTRIKGGGLLTLMLLLAVPHFGEARSARTSAAIESRFSQAIRAIEAEQYLQATQLLTYLIDLPEHAYSAQAQELLGTVREANGQLAHAVAEYRIYLEKYPDGDGAARVSQRLNAILSGARPSQPDPATVAATSAPRRDEDRTASARPSRIRYGRGARPSTVAGGVRAGIPGSQATDPQGRTVTDRGALRLSYRYNEGKLKITELTPDPIPNIEDEDEEVLNNALTTSLNISRVIEDADRKLTLSFSGSYELDFEDSNDNQFRLYDAFVRFERKAGGGTLSFGRHRLKPSGIAYRLDGLSYKWPTASGTELGLFAGQGVQSTRDDFFERGAHLFGASATFEQIWGKGELSAYAVQEVEDGFTLRQAVGLEYSQNRGQTYFFANGEYDVGLRDLNRVLFTTTHTFKNKSRLTGRLAHYRSPALSLNNALIGQSASTLDELRDAGFSDAEIKDLAIDRSSKVTTFGLTYYGKLNETWSLSAFGSLYYTGGTPASGGVAAFEADGTRSYAGFRVIGAGVMKPRDQVNFGLRYSHSDDNDYYLATAGLRYPFNDQFFVRPQFRAGYRDFSDGGDETFWAPSLGLRYKVNRATSLDVEVGGRWSERSSGNIEEDRRELFVNLGLSRSF